MALDYYGSYTNNSLIYEAVTGQTKTITGNTLVPLNTPIIDADITEKFAVICMTGTALRFVSLDSGTTTPYSFDIDESYIKTIKEGLIYDICFNSPIKKVQCTNWGIFITQSSHSYLRAIVSKSVKNNYLDNGIIKYNYSVCIYAEVNGEYVFCLGGYSTTGEDNKSQIQSGMATGIVQFKTNKDYLAYVYYDSYYTHVFSSQYTYFVNMSGYYSFDLDGNNQITDDFCTGSWYHYVIAYNSTDTSIWNGYDYSRKITSYSIAKTWTYNGGIFVLTTNDMLLYIGPNHDYKISPYMSNDHITNPYILSDNANVSDIVHDDNSYTIVPETLQESNGVLNLSQRSLNSAYKISNINQLDSTYSVDQYGSYTNNPLIYEAITGNAAGTSDTNTLLPLNTPIIDASINDKFAVINLAGDKLRFVSMDGTTTPSTFGVPSSAYTVIKSGRIWDITIPSEYVCYHVGALDNGILFSDFNDSEKVMLMKNSSLSGVTYTSTSTSYIYTLTLNSNPVYYYSSNDDNEFEVDHDNFCFIGGSSSSAQNMVTKAGIVANTTVSNCTVHDGKYSYVSGNQIFVKGNFGSFSPTGDSTKSYSTFTNASIFNSYTVSKAWIYGNAIIALTSNGTLLAAGDNSNKRLVPNNTTTLISTPTTVSKSVSTVNDIVYDKSVNSTATSTSYMISDETLEIDSMGTLNLDLVSTTTDKNFTNVHQVNSDLVPSDTGGSSGGTETDNGIGTAVTASVLGATTIRSFTATTSGKTVYYRPRYTIPSHSTSDTSVTVTVGPVIDYGYTNSLGKTYTSDTSPTITLNKSNVSNASTLYTTQCNNLKTKLDSYLTSIKLGKTVTGTLLGADTARKLTSTLRKRDIYYKLSYTIGQHTANDTEVQVTLGPDIYWGYDANDL